MTQCEMCRMIANSVHLVHRMAKEAPTSEEHEDFPGLWEKVSHACDDLPLRFSTPQPYKMDGKKNTRAIMAVDGTCRAAWKEYERHWRALTVNRTAVFARNVCTLWADKDQGVRGAGVCQYPMTFLFLPTDVDLNRARRRPIASPLRPA